MKRESSKFSYEDDLNEVNFRNNLLDNLRILEIFNRPYFFKKRSKALIIVSKTERERETIYRIYRVLCL